VAGAEASGAPTNGIRDSASQRTRDASGGLLTRRACDTSFVRLVVNAICISAALVSPARADQSSHHLRETVTLRVENDVGFSDEDYTSGIFVGLRGPDHTDLLFEERARHVLSTLTAPIGAPLDHVQPELELAQLMYTPHFYWASSIRSLERPFAAIAIAAPTLRFVGRRDEVAFGVVAGAVGRPAETVAFQSLAHRYLSPWSPEPAGWQHQIGDAPYVALRASVSHAFITLGRGRTRFLSIDLANAAEAGTILNHVEGGPRVRVGFFSVDGAGHALSPGDVSALLLGIPDSGFMRTMLRGIEFSFTGSLVYRRVLSNALVEGTIFSESPHTVEARTDVARLEGMLVLDAGPVHLAYGLVARSPETTLARDKPWHVWNRVEAGFRF